MHVRLQKKGGERKRGAGGKPSVETGWKRAGGGSAFNVSHVFHVLYGGNLCFLFGSDLSVDFIPNLTYIVVVCSFLSFVFELFSLFPRRTKQSREGLRGLERKPPSVTKVTITAWFLSGRSPRLQGAGLSILRICMSSDGGGKGK